MFKISWPPSPFSTTASLLRSNCSRGSQFFTSNTLVNSSRGQPLRHYSFHSFLPTMSLTNSNYALRTSVAFVSIHASSRSRPLTFINLSAFIELTKAASTSNLRISVCPLRLIHVLAYRSDSPFFLFFRLQIHYNHPTQ